MFDGVDDGVMKFVGAWPTTVGVQPDELGAGVAMDDPVDVDHGYNLKNEIIEQVLSGFVLRNQKIYYPLKHEPRRRLPWMLSCNNPHRLLVPIDKVRVSDLQQVHLIRTEG